MAMSANKVNFKRALTDILFCDQLFIVVLTFITPT